jgi:uncharacterized membrane protein YbjE (DUF340 family)
MSSMERLIADALHAAGRGQQSPDLFDRIAADIAEDRVRRRKRRTLLVSWFVILVAVAAAVWFVTPRRNGVLLMDWWILELATNAVLIALAFWLGPFIKRFGRAYAADVFHDNPQTGKSYIVLTDIVYYLIFTAYVLFTISFSPLDAVGDGWSPYVGAAQLRAEAARVGGILLIIGVLHGLNIVLMPILGRLFSVNRKLSGR